MLTSMVASVLVAQHQPQPILAYLDPGTGSLVLQATLAAVLSVPFILRSKIASVASWLHGDRSRAMDLTGGRHDRPL